MFAFECVLLRIHIYFEWMYSMNTIHCLWCVQSSLSLSLSNFLLVAILTFMLACYIVAIDINYYNLYTLKWFDVCSFWLQTSIALCVYVSIRNISFVSLIRLVFQAYQILYVSNVSQFVYLHMKVSIMFLFDWLFFIEHQLHTLQFCMRRQLSHIKWKLMRVNEI